MHGLWEADSMIDADNFNSETMSVLLINNFASATMLQVHAWE